MNFSGYADWLVLDKRRMQRGNLRVCKCSSEFYYNKYYTVQNLWSFLVECVYVIIIVLVIYNYHYYVYAHLQSGQCMFTQSSQRIFAQYVGAHACSLISAFLHSLVSAYLLSVVSVYLPSLASAYSHSLVSAQPVLRIFTQSGQCTASASVCICSLVSAQPGQRIFAQSGQCSCCNKCVQYKIAFFLKGSVLLFWVRWILTSYKHNNSKC